MLRRKVAGSSGYCHSRRNVSKHIPVRDLCMNSFWLTRHLSLYGLPFLRSPPAMALFVFLRLRLKLLWSVNEGSSPAKAVSRMYLSTRTLSVTAKRFNVCSSNRNVYTPHLCGAEACEQWMPRSDLLRKIAFGSSQLKALGQQMLWAFLSKIYLWR